MKKIYLKENETFDYFLDVEVAKKVWGEDAVGVRYVCPDGFWHEVTVREDAKGYFYYEYELYED